ncbi:MAG TPA: hypothetical protein PKE32_04065 [Miltoncostaeaceae bacterium]|nr:hypothetical protein [Miltoncostaeaceae bacterium]
MAASGAGEQSRSGGTCKVPGQRAQQRLGTVGGPPWQLPSALLAFGALGFLAGALALVFSAPDFARLNFYGPVQLATVHLFALAFMSVVIVGVLFQMVPVLLRRALAAPGPGVAIAVGVAGGAWALVAGFLLDRDLAVATGGTVVLIAGGAFVICAARAILAARAAGTFGAAGAGLLVAVSWFAITLLAGATMAANLVWSFLPVARRIDIIAAHATVAIGGWIVGMILVMAMKLAPMLSLAHARRPQMGNYGLAAWHVGLVPTALGLLFGVSWLTGIGVVILLVAALTFAAFTLDVIRSRKRELQAPLVHLAFGVAALVAAALVALWALWGDGNPIRAAVAAGILVLVGFGAGVTAGHLFKLLPMVVWTGIHAKRANQPGAPRLSDMYPDAWARVEQVAFICGVTVLTVAVLGGWGPPALVGALAIFAAAIATGIACARFLWMTRADATLPARRPGGLPAHLRAAAQGGGGPADAGGAPKPHHPHGPHAARAADAPTGATRAGAGAPNTATSPEADGAPVQAPTGSSAAEE